MKLPFTKPKAVAAEPFGAAEPLALMNHSAGPVSAGAGGAVPVGAGVAAVVDGAVAVQAPRPAARRMVVLSRYSSSQDSDERDWDAVTTNQFEDVYFTGQHRATTIARFRKEVHENPYLSGLVEKFPEAIGIPHFRARTSDAAYNDELDALFYRFSKKVSTQDDSLLAAIRITLRELLLTGEMYWVLLANGRTQLIESQFCGTPYGIKALDREINGVVYDKNWLPVAYRFSSLDKYGMLSAADAQLVEAKNVIHVYPRERVNQGRGLPLLLPALNTARDLYEITRAKTKQIKDANKISGTIEKEGAAAMLSSFGGEATTTSAAVPTDSEPVKIDLRPGTFVALEPGEKLNMLTTKYEAADYKELIQLMLHAIASPVGLPVELWFSGLGDVNYSGFKGLGTVWEGRRLYYISIIEDRLLNRLAMWKTQGSRKAGLVSGNPDDDDDLFEWAWRHKPVLDEEKDASAANKRLESGVGWLPEEWEKRGYYTEEVLARRKGDWAKLQAACGLDPATPPPIEFLWKGQLPAKQAAQPAGTDSGEGDEDPPAGDPEKDAEDGDPEKDGAGDPKKDAEADA